MPCSSLSWRGKEEIAAFSKKEKEPFLPSRRDPPHQLCPPEGGMSARVVGSPLPSFRMKESIARAKPKELPTVAARPEGWTPISLGGGEPRLR